MDPPEDLTQIIGPRPVDEMRGWLWDEIVVLHAKARLEWGPTADLLDPNLGGVALYQTSVSDYTLPPLSVKAPVLAIRPES